MFRINYAPPRNSVKFPLELRKGPPSPSTCVAKCSQIISFGASEFAGFIRQYWSLFNQGFEGFELLFKLLISFGTQYQKDVTLHRDDKLVQPMTSDCPAFAKVTSIVYKSLTNNRTVNTRRYSGQPCQRATERSERLFFFTQFVYRSFANRYKNCAL